MDIKMNLAPEEMIAMTMMAAFILVPLKSVMAKTMTVTVLLMKTAREVKPLRVLLNAIIRGMINVLDGIMVIAL